MKPIVTLLFVLTLGAVALANPRDNHDEVYPAKVAIVLDDCTIGADTHKTIALATDKEVARLYRRKNILVKKALDFRTKWNKAKLA